MPRTNQAHKNLANDRTRPRSASVLQGSYNPNNQPDNYQSPDQAISKHGRLLASPELRDCRVQPIFLGRRGRYRKPPISGNGITQELAVGTLSVTIKVALCRATTADEMDHEENQRKDKKKVDKSSCYMENDERSDPGKKQQERDC